MTSIESELRDIALEMHDIVEQAQSPEIADILQALKRAAEEVGMAWSGSWLGYHASVYYRGFRRPPADAWFSQEWGLMNRPYFNSGTTGDWVRYDQNEVESTIYRLAGDPEMMHVRRFWDEADRSIRRCRNSLLSIVEMGPDHAGSTFLTGKKDELARKSLRSDEQFLAESRPTTGITKDVEVLGKGPQSPPHLRMLAQVSSWNHATTLVEDVRDIAEELEAHFARKSMQSSPTGSTGNKVFIGHGHSLVWRELKDFLEDRLGLSVEEFNSVSTAGVTTTARLQSMLSEAGFAFLIMTGEDESGDGRLRARENVIHEMGLFQGRLEFEKAIILLEEGCEEFSNIHGLGHIPFPKGNIAASFEEIRRVLEREGLVQAVRAS